jgi:Urocanase Rossmann-like domain
MPQFPASEPNWQSRLEPVFRLYAGLLRGRDPEMGLGGKLLWTCELDENGCNLMRAANIAGAASLGATADPALLRHANRDGVADFLVTSLDEALRILKNEVRKQQTVSVGVSMDPGVIAAEMLERGVLPDLLPPADSDGGEDLAWFLAHGSRRVEIGPLPKGWRFKAWAASPPQFGERAAAALPGDDHLNRRWLRLSPRYLGPVARRVRSLSCTAETEARLAKTLAERESS